MSNLSEADKKDFMESGFPVEVFNLSSKSVDRGLEILQHLKANKNKILAGNTEIMVFTYDTDQTEDTESMKDAYKRFLLYSAGLRQSKVLVKYISVIQLVKEIKEDYSSLLYGSEQVLAVPNFIDMSMMSNPLSIYDQWEFIDFIVSWLDRGKGLAICCERGGVGTALYQELKDWWGVKLATKIYEKMGELN